MKDARATVSIRQNVKRALRASKIRRENARVLAVLAVFVSLAVAGILMQHGRAMTHEERVLDCPVAADGAVAHAHDESCYDEEGRLVCQLPEVELHVHDDSCYTEERTLACGLEEGEGHTHDESCYEVTRTLTCGKGEVTEEHVHGQGCFRTVVVEDGDAEETSAVESSEAAGAQDSPEAIDQVDEASSAEPSAVEAEEPVDEETAKQFPAQTFEQKFVNSKNELQLRVFVDAPAGALPEGTTMKAEMVSPKKVDQDLVQDAVSKKTEGKVLEFQAVDITFHDAQGREIEPRRHVTVTMTSALAATDEQPVVVHVESDREAAARAEAQGERTYEIEADVVDQLSDRELNMRDMSLAEDQLAFDSDAFSTYVLATTSRDHTMRSTDGQTVAVTVDAKANAGIPQDAVIQVSEIGQGTEEYETYLAQATEALGADGVSFARFFDINIESGDQTLQPQAPVGVQIELMGAQIDADQSSMRVVHFGKEGPEVLNTSLENDTVSFEASGFSVYAVVEEGSTADDARMTITFHKADGTTAQMIVKNRDKDHADDSQAASDHYKLVLYDPGVGTLDEGLTFKGWTTSETYDLNTEAKTIEDIRSDIKAITIAEGDTRDYYPVLVKDMTVTYLDEKGTSMGSENITILPSQQTSPYTVNMAYTVPSGEQNFEGWLVHDGANHIVGYDSANPTVYPNGSEIEISGDVTFSVNAPTGHWLIFNENGRGATYNAPQFIKSGEVTREPTITMERTGYEFGGWYTNAACTAGNEFTFGRELEQSTTVYAKWTPKATAKYTVIVWKQSVSDAYDAADTGKTYDFAFSTQLETNSNTPVASLNLSAYQNKDGQTITVDGERYSFYGFKYNTTKGVKANETTVLPNGTTVINLYYDREVVTYDFRLRNGYKNAGTPNWNSGTTYYYRSNGNYYVCSRVNNNTYYYIPVNGNLNNNTTYYIQFNGQWYPYLRVNFGTWYNPNYQWVFEYEGEYYLYNGPKYTRNQVTGGNPTYYVENWQTRETFTGLYGQKLNKYDYTWPTDYRWLNDINGSTFTSIQDVFGSSVNDNPTSAFHSDYYGELITANTNVYHYLQNVDGSWPSTPTYTIPTVIGNGMVFRNFQGFTESEFRIKLPDGVNSYQTGTSYNGDDLVNPVTHYTSDGWTDWLPYGTGVEYAGNSRHETTRWSVTEGGIEFRYARNEYKLTYMVGEFVNANGEKQEAPISGMLKEVDHIEFEDSLESYAKGGDNYYEPAAQPGYVFEGWYIDSTCTTPVDFANTTMPINGMTVYGKWRQTQYRVFLHPNVPTTDTIDWGSNNQQMTFRVSYGDKVSAPTGRRNGDQYEMVGWFLDEACTQVFNGDAYVMNDTNVTADYDKTVDMTDVMDKWGNGATTNADLDRPWITKKLDLYAKWRKVLVGSDGIIITYDPNGGSSAPHDTKKYLDASQAIAQGAATAPSGKVFKCWVLQTWDEAQGKYVDTTTQIYPGDQFEVLVDNARQQQNSDHTPEHPSYTYTVQLRAEYIDLEDETPTHIYWYANNHSGNVIKTNETSAGAEPKEFLQINEAVFIKKPTDFDSVSRDSAGWYHFTNDTGFYKFLGWARVPEDNGQDKALTKNDLFLIYDEATESYKLADGTTVTRVAADEMQPYHDMYAVWERWGYLKVGKHFDVQEFYLDGVDMETRWHTLEFTIKDSSGNYVKLKDDPGTESEGHYIYDGTQTERATITLSTFVHETGTANPHEHQYFIYVWLPVDTYTVEEDHQQAEELLTGYARQTSDYVKQATVTNSCVYGELTNIGSGEARIDNNYRGSHNYAYLQVEKLIAGNIPGSLTDNKDFYFVVKNNTLNAYVSKADRTFTTNQAQIAIYHMKPGGAIYDWNGNPVNGNHIQVVGDNSYSIIELDQSTTPVAPESPAIAGYAWERTVSPESVVADKDEEKKVTITNTYTPQFGFLEIEKVVAGDLPTGVADHEFKVTVQRDADGKYVKADGTVVDTPEEILLKPGAGNKITIPNLEPGSYTVTEIIESPDPYPSYTLTVSVQAQAAEAEAGEADGDTTDTGGTTDDSTETDDAQASNAASTTVAVGETARIVVTNTYERKGQLVKFVKVDMTATKDDYQQHTLENAVFVFTPVGGQATTLTSGSNGVLVDREGTGVFTIEATDGTSDVNKLVENQPPAGYNALTSPVNVYVQATATGVTVEARSESGTQYDVIAPTQEGDPYIVLIPNNPGVALPNSGGIGTTLHMVAGLVLVAVGMTMLLRRQRGLG